MTDAASSLTSASPSPIARRVVLGTGADGRSAVIHDTPVQPTPAGSASAPVVLWRTDRSPVSNAGDEDQGGGAFSLGLPRGGSVFMLVDMPARGGEMGGMGLHATDTIDYAAVISGRVAIVTESGEAELNPGDVVVDRGVIHAWRVLSDTPARLAIVMLDAEPLGTTREHRP